MRKGCKPTFVDESGHAAPLQRVEFSDGSVAETFLQEALDRVPEILPVDELDSSYGPLISLGREIDYIDNLFISPTGRITIVETKLWRNPEATRQVVAQILDYATRVSSWSYSGLERRAREALAPAPIGTQSLYEYVASEAPDEALPESEFVDAVQAGLSSSRFMLLIVGDGIRESIESMVSSLHDHPHRLFTFGLVQLQIFRDPGRPNTHLVVPQIVANTQEISRYVVRVESTGQANVSVEIENREPDEAGSGPRRNLTATEFFDELRDTETRTLFRKLIDLSIDLGITPVWRASGVSMRLSDPRGTGTRFTLFVLSKYNTMYAGWLPQQLEKASLPEGIARDYARQLIALFPAMSLVEGGLETTGTVDAAELATKFDQFTGIVEDLVNRLKTA